MQRVKGIRKQKLKTNKFGRSNRLFLQVVTFVVAIWCVYIVSTVLLVLVWLFPNELVVLLNRLSIGSVAGWESGLVQIQIPGVDVLNFKHIKIVWSMEEKIAIVDKLMLEFRLDHWADTEAGFQRWRTALLNNFITPELTRVELEELHEQLFSAFSAMIDDIYKIMGWRPVPSLETRQLWFDTYESKEEFLTNLRKEEMLKHPDTGPRRTWGGFKKRK